MVEAKLDEQDDPFKVKSTVEGFLCDNERARQTLGQLTSYATAHLAAQFRIHVFLYSFFPQVCQAHAMGPRRGCCQRSYTTG